MATSCVRPTIDQLRWLQTRLPRCDKHDLFPPVSTPAEIERMTPIERLKTMELIWDSLVRDAESIESPAWHGEILKGRLEKIRKGEAKFLDLEEVKRSLGR
jgi:hypothetical protein